jgi:CRP-like cAMP-binding protein
VAGVQNLTTTLREGEFFGEAALSGEARDVTVIASGETDLYVLAQSDFQEAIESSANLMQRCCERSSSGNHDRRRIGLCLIYVGSIRRRRPMQSISPRLQIRLEFSAM